MQGSPAPDGMVQFRDTIDHVPCQVEPLQEEERGRVQLTSCSSGARHNEAVNHGWVQGEHARLYVMESILFSKPPAVQILGLHELKAAIAPHSMSSQLIWRARIKAVWICHTEL